MFWWRFLDALLFLLHILIILFNIFGWIFPKWRGWHFWCVMLTCFSWVILGFWKGWGYCFLTDWAWQVKSTLGETDLPNSFITYLINNSLGFNVPPHIVDQVTVGVFIFCVIAAIYFRLAKKHRKGQPNHPMSILLCLPSSIFYLLSSTF